MIPFDNTYARKEGWFISQTSGVNEPYRLERDDEAGKFIGDGAAWHHVVSLAKAGSAYHQAALAWLKEHSPNEYETIRLVEGRLQ